MYIPVTLIQSDVPVLFLSGRCTGLPYFSQMYMPVSLIESDVPVSFISGRCTGLPHFSKMYVPVTLIQSDVPVSFFSGRCTGLPHFNQMYIPVTLIQSDVPVSILSGRCTGLSYFRCTYHSPSFSQMYIPVSLISEQEGLSKAGQDPVNASSSETSAGTLPVRVPLRSRSISRYGSSLEPPSDDSIFYVQDDDFGMFASVSYVTLIIEQVLCTMECTSKRLR